jgi:hypothetical protein
MTDRLWTHNIFSNADGETTLVLPRRHADGVAPIDLSMRIASLSAERSKAVARAGRARNETGGDQPR